jgi:hypothetical protein
MAEDKGKGQNEDPISDDGTEGSTTGYMTAGQMKSESVKRNPDTDKGENKPDDDDEFDDDEEDLEGDDDKSEKLSKREKELQKAYTTKFRELSKKRGMIQMMEQIQEDPQNMIPWLAEKLGVKLVKEGTTKEKDEVKFETPDLSAVQPGENETMPAYINRVFTAGMKGLVDQIPKAIAAGMKGSSQVAAKREPLFPKEDKNADSIQDAIKELDEKHDDWPLYEDEMVKVLKDKPSLISDPEKLYAEAKKSSNLFTLTREKSKAKKLENRKFSTGSRGSGKRQTQKKGKVMNFAESWERAKQDVVRRK